VSTTTSTLPSRALVERDVPTTPAPRPEPIQLADRPSERPSRKGIFDVLRVLVSDDGQRPASDPLLLLGPNGGPVWTARTQ
jgi:hypothetical protein